MRADPVQVPAVNPFHDFGLLGHDAQRPAFFLRQLVPLIAVGVAPTEIFSFLDRRDPARDKPPVDGLKFAAGHEKPELEIVLVHFIGRVVGFVRRDDFGAGRGERLRDHALIDAVAARKALDLHDQHALPFARRDFFKKLLHLRARRQRFARHDFLVHRADVKQPVPRQIKQRRPVPRKGLALAARFRFAVFPRFP